MKFFGANNHGAKKVEMLKSIPIFQTLTRNELLEVDELLHERSFETGEIVFERVKWAAASHIATDLKLIARFWMSRQMADETCKKLPAHG